MLGLLKRTNNLFLLVLLLLLPLRVNGKNTLTDSPTHSNQAVTTDESKQELKAYLLIVSPGKALYSSLGHSALRLQAPAFGLDYCFTYEADADNGILDYLCFFAAKAEAHWVAVKSEQYFSDYAKEHRKVLQYELALTHKEIQQLWKNLDEAVTSGQTERFDFLTNNCTQGLLRMLDISLDRPLELKEPKSIAALDNGQLARYVTRNSPWMQFLVITLMGAQADGHWSAGQRATPEILQDDLPQPLRRRGDLVTQLNAPQGKDRVTDGTEKFNDNWQTDDTEAFLTPNVVFSSILIIAIILVVIKLYIGVGSKSLTRCIHLPSFGGVGGGPQSLTRCLHLPSFGGVGGGPWWGLACLWFILFWLTQISGLFTVGDGGLLSHWNWYLIPLFPFPLLFYLYRRLCKDKGKAEIRVRQAYRGYIVLLVLFIAATPLSSQLDWTHQLITAIIVVCCLPYAIKLERKKKNK